MKLASDIHKEDKKTIKLLNEQYRSTNLKQMLTKQQESAPILKAKQNSESDSIIKKTILLKSTILKDVGNINAAFYSKNSGMA